MKNTRKMPLEGIRIVEFTTAWVGPECGYMLGQMGAEIIKVENPKLPDYWRRCPAFADDIRGVNRSGIFAGINRGKKSCILDLKNLSDLATVKRLIKISDIVVTNFAPRVMGSLGLGYDELKKIKPDIIMVAASGYGATGPDKECVAFGHVLEAYSGMTSVLGNRGGPPMQCGTTVSDHTGAIVGCFATLVALYYRMLTGEGQYIDLSEVEGVVGLLPEVVMDYVMNGRIRTPQGNRNEVMAPHGCFQCKGDDKWVAIAVKTNEEWRSLCLAMEKPELAEDERFSDGFLRLAHQDEIEAIVNDWTKDLTHLEVMERLQKVKVAAGPVYSGEEIYNDAHLRARRFFVAHEHPETGKRELPGVIARLSETPYQIKDKAPLYGEHTEWVINELLAEER
ncbi:MAG: CoA transferase [Dehalococcoidales bacterium]|nr:CoA transferase [Dehalococcoidales bacterium]